MTRPAARLATLARDVRSCSNRIDLVRSQQDRDQILFTIHAGTAKASAAAERYAARANQLAGLEAALEQLLDDVRKTLDDLTLGQAKRDDDPAPKPKRKKRKHEADS